MKRKLVFIALSIFLSIRIFGQWYIAPNTITGLSMYRGIDFFDEKTIVTQILTRDISYNNHEKIIMSDDMGLSWRTCDIMGDDGINAFSCVRNSDVIYVSTHSRIYKSSSRGSSWDSIPYSITGINNRRESFEQIVFLSENIGFGIIGYTIYKTTDGCKTWNEHIVTKSAYNINLATTGEVLVSLSDSVYLIDKDDAIRKIKIPCSVSKDIDFPTKDHGYIIEPYTSSGNVFETTDGGQNWKKMSFPYVMYPFNVSQISFCSATVGVAVRDHLVFHMTKDAGKTWTTVHNPVDYQNLTFETMLMINQTTAFGVSTIMNKTFYVATDLDVNATISAFEDQKAINNDIQIIYEKGNLNISFVNNIEIIDLQISSIDGKLLYQDNSPITISNDIISKNIDLKSGIYFANLKSQSESKTIKFIVQ